MPSGKLRLNLAALRLKSFETTPDTGAMRGTVAGMDESQCSPCTNCTFNTATCSALTMCGNGSCQNTCLNASVTDSNCYGTEFCETEGYGC
jgi:hypothetical protein